MSLLRMPKMSNVRSAWERLCDSFFRPESPLKDRKGRQLRIDQLEERTLLSVSLGTVTNVLVNQVTNSASGTAQAVATDHNGDFVVVYTRTDPVLDANGNQAYDPASGAALSGTNVYARYYTNEVQRIVLPAGVLTANPSNAGAYATFSLVYGGNEVQQLDFAQSPATALAGAQLVAPISGTFQLSYTDPVTHATSLTYAINFDEGNFGAPQWTSPTTAAVSDTDTVIKVKSANAGLVGYSVEIGTEHMLVTAVDTTTNELTVTRGTGGTTATAHVLGSTVQLLDDAGQIQDAICALGGDLADVTVTAISPKQYTISFGDASGGRTEPLLEVTNDTWATGFLPSATVSITSAPIVIGISPITGTAGIFVSRTSPAMTAASIQSYFDLAQTFYTGPVFYGEMPADGGPDATTVAVPQVTVVSVKTADDPQGLRTFDITFVGNSGDQDLPQLVIPAGKLLDATGAKLNATADIDGTITKESSQEFRVNPEVPSNPFVTMPEDCSSPAVAMDADGNFVIVWTAAVSDLVDYGSGTDVFGRMFEPVGMVDPGDPVLGLGVWKVDMNNDGIPDTLIQGVRPLVSPIPYNASLPDELEVPGDIYTFRVNTSTTNAQGNPAVAMDNAGNFVVTWSDTGQTLSFFNDIRAQQFTHNGNPLGGEVQVSMEQTNREDNSYVAMSQDGHWVVVWENWMGGQLPMETDGKLYDAQGDVLSYAFPGEMTDPLTGGPSGQFTIESNSEGPTAAFDEINDFVIGWDTPLDTDNIPTTGLAKLGVYAREYDLAGDVIRPDFRVNSASIDPTTNTTWPEGQSGAQVVMDADGDLTVSYSGFGPDIAEIGASGNATALMTQMLNEPQNADLLAAWPALANLALPLGQLGTDYDPDSEIEEVLILAQANHGFTAEQLGRLNQIMNDAVGLTRGDANAVMYSQFDADPRLNPSNSVLSSDNVVNSTRDGTNYRTTLTLDNNITSGTFDMYVVGPASYVKVTISPVYDPTTPPIIDAALTTQAIQATLDSSALDSVLGINWPDPNHGGQYMGTFSVRLMTANEVTTREGTNWELPNVNPATTYTWEITFLGESHDTAIQLIPVNSSLMVPAGTATVPADPPLMIDETYATAGTDQSSASVAMTPDGSFVYVYTQTETDSTGNATNTNVYFQTFNESQNTAGPEVAEVLTPSQSTIDAGSQVTTASGLQHVVVSFDQPLNNVVPTTYLTSALSASATTISVSSPATFPTTGPFTIIVDHEHMLVVGGYGTKTWTVTRGTDNTTAAAHTVNASVVAPTGNAASNPANYELLLNGKVVQGAITEVDYGMSEASELARDAVNDPTNWGSYSDLSLLPSNHWEAVLTIDGNGTAAGDPLLGAGNYTLVVLTPQTATPTNPAHTGIVDLGGQALGANGFTSIDADTTRAGLDYNITFQIVTGNQNPGTGTEFLVNQNPSYQQTLGTSRSVAEDHSGDFVVVWTSTGEDGDSNPADANYDPNWATDTGVYMRLYDRNNNPLTNETLVNTTTIGNQIDPTVAMDADGDFVVVWASQGQDGDGWGIYGQRFNSVGNKVGGEFQVNTTTIGDQVTPSVATDDFGNFVVTWASGGDTFGYDNNIYAQTYNSDGQKVSNEIRVNSQNVPGFNGVPNIAISNPVVAASDTGVFTVAWVDVTSQVNGVITGTQIVARMFDTNGNAVTTAAGNNTEFAVNVSDANFLSDATHTPKYAAQNAVLDPQITMDRNGNFIVAWEAYQDDDSSAAGQPTSWGIYFRRFAVTTDTNGNTVLGTPVTASDEQANLVITNATPVNNGASFAGNQLNPSLAMTVNGLFTISWDGPGAQPDPLQPTNLALAQNADSQGTWTRSFQAMGNAPTALEAIAAETRANMTTIGYQQYSSVAMTPAGGSVVVWSGNGVGDSQGIFARRNAPTSADHAGPMLTNFLLPDGTPVANSGEITQSLQAVVVTFDEALYDNATHTGNAASNPANYQLLQNGVAIAGGISQVFYGLDEANVLGSQYGLNVPKLNKYEAVLIVDSNGPTSGVAPLINGQYQVVVLNTIRDVAGNPLVSSGATGPFSPGPNGGLMSTVIYIQAPTGQETRVNSTPTPPSSPAGTGHYTYASTADSVASDANGDYVVAWTDTTTGSQGVWAQMYRQTVTVNADGSRATSVAPLGNAIQVSTSSYATDISVARSVDGDFVVTWSDWNATTSWDVYAERFNAAGQSQGSAFRVNGVTADVQRYSSVAMDAQGDFVITWQSNNQDGSGYGIYAQTYSSTGQAVSGTDDVQAIDFNNGFTGSFKLRWDNDNNPSTPDAVSASITYNGNASTILTAVQNALQAMGAQVDVVANGLSEVDVVFVGTSGNMDLPQMWIAPGDIVQTGGTTSASVLVSTVTHGDGGFRVNDTTVGNQEFPDVAMDAAGDFVVTWTSYGQGADSAIQSNVYAKQYGRTSAVWIPASTTSGLPQTLGGQSSGSSVSPKVVSVDAPANHAVPPAVGYDGVVEVDVVDNGVGYMGSGSLLAGGNWILTAAHVVWSDTNGAPLPASAVTVTFYLTGGPVTVQATKVIVNPGYNGDVTAGNDLALVQIQTVPTGVTGYQIYAGTDAVGQVAMLMGYGETGLGTTGETAPANGVKHYGFNIFDATGAVAGYPDTTLMDDFDDGTPQHDAMGVVYGIHNLDTNIGTAEVDAAHGDSGGPWFVNYNLNNPTTQPGQIAAIVSFGYGVAPADIDNDHTNSSFGEFNVETNVSDFAGWIASVTSTGSTEFLVNADDAVNAANGTLSAVLDNEAGNQSHSSVAMDSAGDFVITWTGYGRDGVGNGYGPGVNGENGVFARRYSAGFNPTTAQPNNVFLGDPSQASDVFQVNQTAAGSQQNARVDMDAAGDFTVAWESNQNGNYDIYARNYIRTSQVQYAVNANNANAPLLIFGGNALYATDTFPITVLQVVNNQIQTTQTTIAVNNGAIGGEFEVNSTQSGDQRFPGVALDDTGDLVVVWSGNGQQAGQQDPQGVFYQRFDPPTDTAGPTVGEVLNVVTSGSTTTYVPIPNSSVLDAGPTQLVVTFGEALSTTGGSGGATSVLNLANWQLTDNGVVVNGAIVSVTYSFNTTDDKYEAVITLDGDTTTAGNQPLTAGRYVLSILGGKTFGITDLFGNKLDGDYNGAPGGNFTLTFTVPTSGSGGGGGGGGGGGTVITPPGTPGTGSTDQVVNTYATDTTDVVPDVATDANGNYVVVWAAQDAAGLAGNGLIEEQRFNQYGQPLDTEYTVNTTALGARTDPKVAMDPYGDYVVVWSGLGADGNAGIFAQIFDKDGYAVGSEFRVNQTLGNPEQTPDVAMDANGDFTVTWAGYNPANGYFDIYARRFSVQGTALSNEFVVNTTLAGQQEQPDIGMDSAGDSVVVWQSYQQDGSDWGVFGQRLDASGNKLGGEFQVNTYTQDKQDSPAVAMNASGAFVVAWESFGQDGSAVASYGIYARRYSAGGAALDAAGFLVNQTTLNWQVTPDVGIASNGNFDVAWSSFQDQTVVANQTITDYGIYARMYNADGTNYAAASGTVGEFRVNAGTLGDQVTPALSTAANGKFAVAWAGPDNNGVGPDEDVFSRVIDPTATLGPAIGGVYVVPSSGVMSWNAQSSKGVKSASLKVDGAASQVYGPYTAASGVNFSGSFGSLASGNHTYSITTIDTLGNPSVYTGTFNYVNPGPAVSGVYIVPASGIMSWNAADPDGVASATLKVDGVSITKLYGPSAAASGVNFSGVFGTLAAGSHSYTITAVDKLGDTSTTSGSFTVGGTTNPGPVIGGVYIVPASGIMSWNAADSDGVASSTLKVDGAAVSKVYGPYTAASGVNFSGQFGTLAAGNHTYVITATDKLGNASTSSGNFTVAAATNPGPVISGVYIVPASGIMSWNAADSDGVASSTLKVDSVSVSKVYGPYTAASGVNFSGAFGSLAAGSHTYVITATDKLGNASTSSGNFTVAAATNPGPVISAVYIPAGLGIMSWNAVDSDGVAGSSLKVDGVSVSQVYGPYTAASGVNFSGAFGTLSAGSHTYVITATDKLGNSSTQSGSFTVVASGAAKSLARSTVMESLSAGVTASAKVDWLCDVPASLFGTDESDSGDAVNAVDAVLAAYV